MTADTVSAVAELSTRPTSGSFIESGTSTTLLFVPISLSICKIFIKVFSFSSSHILCCGRLPCSWGFWPGGDSSSSSLSLESNPRVASSCHHTGQKEYKVELVNTMPNQVTFTCTSWRRLESRPIPGTGVVGRGERRPCLTLRGWASRDPKAISPILSIRLLKSLSGPAPSSRLANSWQAFVASSWPAPVASSRQASEASSTGLGLLTVLQLHTCQTEIA